MKVFPLTKVEVSKRALLNNLQQFKKRIGSRAKIMAVVKANAYGHGIREVAGVVSEKVDWFGVDKLEEGLLLRKEKVRLPILVLGYIPREQIGEAIKNDLSFVAYHREISQRANLEAKKINQKARIHLKVETGTNRQGIGPKEIISLAKFCAQQKHLSLEGVCTHYANVEDTLDHRFAMEQLTTFREALQLIKAAKIKIPVKHTACSAAAILFPETYFNLIRLGIGLYGLWPSRETQLSAKEKGIKFDLQPVLNWKTEVVQVKKVKKGETIGYGRTYRASREMKIAILPVGYWDGYDRELSNSGRVLIKGQLAPVVGRICMNMTMVDITDISGVRLEEEVILLGKQGRNEITAEEIAAKTETINYEIMTRINPLLPRRVV